MENKTNITEQITGNGVRVDFKDGLKIELCKNSIRFETPDGQRFYKNLTNFMEVCLKSHPTRSTFTFAPKDEGKPATAQQAVVAATTPVTAVEGTSASC